MLSFFKSIYVKLFNAHMQHRMDIIGCNNL
jgi:hypothetical protein